MRFDRSLIPISSVLTETIAFASSFALIALMMGVYGVAPTPAMAWLPVVVVVTVFFGVAIAYPGALLGLWFPDVRFFVISFVRTLFFVSSGLVALDTVAGRAADLLRINPLTGIFEAYRDVLLYGQRPAAWERLFPVGLSVVRLVLFVPLSRREQSQFAKIVG
jgi:lipopolysaccharide transport system permease protein